MTAPVTPPPRPGADVPEREGWLDLLVGPIVDHIVPRAPGRAAMRIVWVSAGLAALAMITPESYAIGTAPPLGREGVALLLVLTAAAAWMQRHLPDPSLPIAVPAALVAAAVLFSSAGTAAWGLGFFVFVVATLRIARWRRSRPARRPIDDPDPLPPSKIGFPRLVHGIAITLAVVLILRQFALESRHVPTGSMQPTIMGARPHSSGDFVLVNRFGYLARDPRRWEIVVFDYPLQPQVSFVKRCIGLPGETVEIRNGDIWVDGAVARKPAAVQASLWQERFPRASPLAKPKKIAGSFSLNEDDGWRRDGDGVKIKTRGTAVAYARYSRRKLKQHDLRLSTTVEPLEGDGVVVLELDVHGKTLTLTVPFGAGDTPGSLALEDGADVSFDVRAGAQSLLQLAAWEGGAEARIDGLLVAELATPNEGRGKPQVRIGAAGAVRFGDIRVDEDLGYVDKGRPKFTVPDDGFVMLGDNTLGSEDSRLWAATEYHVRGMHEPLLAAPSVPDPDTGQPRDNVVRKDGTYSLVDIDGAYRTFPAADLVKRKARPMPFVRRKHLTGRATAIFWPWTVHEAGFRPRILP